MYSFLSISHRFSVPHSQNALAFPLPAVAAMVPAALLHVAAAAGRVGDGAHDLAGVLVRLRVEPLDVPRHLAHVPDAVGDRPHHVLAVSAVQVPPPPAEHR